mmetsp:Transcript_100849/g.256603  ORF Transcript_100849/g.256603 Transcript_100849/m.256603 type:complete len:202 (+) Transcript_100849:366-971(+)
MGRECQETRGLEEARRRPRRKRRRKRRSQRNSKRTRRTRRKRIRRKRKRAKRTRPRRPRPRPRHRTAATLPRARNRCPFWASSRHHRRAWPLTQQLCPPRNACASFPRSHPLSCVRTSRSGVPWPQSPMVSARGPGARAGPRIRECRSHHPRRSMPRPPNEAAECSRCPCEPAPQAQRAPKPPRPAPLRQAWWAAARSPRA